MWEKISLFMTLANINYIGRVLEDVSHLRFRTKAPKMYVHKCDGGFTIIIFQNKKCRIMGCKSPITSLSGLPFKIVIQRILSVTATMDMGCQVNLRELATHVPCIYEPELFCALRMTAYRPLCVNVFGTGKVVITGLKSIHFSKICCEIRDKINMYE